MASNKNVEPAWHPDFRDVELLPDTKSVTTKFIVNAASVLLAVVAIGLVVFSELNTLAIRSELKKQEQKLEALEPGDRKAVSSYNKFLTHSLKLEQVNAFGEAPCDMAQAFLAIGELVPDVMSLKFMSYNTSVEAQKGKKTFRRRQLILDGTVEGGPQEAPVLVNKLIADIAEAGCVKSSIEEIKLGSLSRTAEEESFVFKILITFYPWDSATGALVLPKAAASKKK